MRLPQAWHGELCMHCGRRRSHVAVLASLVRGDGAPVCGLSAGVWARIPPRGLPALAAALGRALPHGRPGHSVHARLAYRHGAEAVLLCHERPRPVLRRPLRVAYWQRLMPLVRVWSVIVLSGAMWGSSFGG